MLQIPLGACETVVGNDIFIFGGYSESYEALHQLLKLTPTTETDDQEWVSFSTIHNVINLLFVLRLRERERERERERQTDKEREKERERDGDDDYIFIMLITCV